MPLFGANDKIDDYSAERRNPLHSGAFSDYEV